MVGVGGGCDPEAMTSESRDGYVPPNRVEMASLLADLERMRKALQRIAAEDYRGPRPWSAQVAQEALDA